MRSLSNWFNGLTLKASCFAGRRTLDTVMRVSADFEAQMCAGLKAAEREQLIALLNRIVTEQGLAPDVHPGLARDGARNPDRRP